MRTESRDRLALVRLLQLASPSLPVGAYAYSQGIEWAVEAGWIGNRDELGRWLGELAETSLVHVDLPILARMLAAWENDDPAALAHWSDTLVASRETRELRDEERNRARAFAELLASLEPAAAAHRDLITQSQLAGYGFACHRWQIEYREAATALAWNWLENLVLAAVKIIPLGQTAGQQLIFDLSAAIPDLVARAGAIDDDEIGASAMALAIASANHETQYTRLFRS